VDQALKAPPLSSHPVDIGQRTEAAILAELVRRGYRVLVPFGTNQRYDLVIDLDGAFVRVQCKTGRLRNGSIVFSTKSVQTNTRRSLFRGYLGDADLFMVHCPQNGGIYVMSVADAPKGYGYLRVGPTRNRQARRVRWAKDYELPA
jgi:hypothetical protein